jgi:hypothetical protein
MSTSAADSNARLEALSSSESMPSGSPAASGQESTSSRGAHHSREGTFWLNGGVLACACPACGAPMTIRLWLMMADCWRCNASLELTEEQEREALELIALVEPALLDSPLAVSPPVETLPPEAPKARLAPPVAPAASPVQTNGEVAAPAPKPVKRAPAPQPVAAAELVARQAVAAPPDAVPRPQRQPQQTARSRPYRSVLEPREHRGRSLWKDLPAYIITLVIHLVAMLLLGMWSLEKEDSPEDFVVTVELGPQRLDGGLVESEIVINENDFDLPIDKQPTTKQEKEALVRADEDARELRLDPQDANRTLPPLTRVKSDLVSNDPYKRMQAARDPRVRSEVVRREGGTTQTEAAVARGLRWISRHQNEDGSWSLHEFNRTHQCNGQCGGHGGVHSDTSATAMALMAMLGAGQTHTSGIYRDQVSQALRWLVEHQKPDGDLRAHSAGNSGMYAHGQAAIVLCDAFKLTGDESLREPAQKAIDFVCEAQHPQGGWRYSPGEAGDLSVVGWQLMAMHSAKSAYLTVPKRNQNQAGRFLDRVQADEVGGLYSYTPNSGPTPTMTAEGLLSRMYLGWDAKKPGLKSGVNFLVENHLPNERQKNMYYWYYGTQVMHHWGGDPWEKWNVAMRETLVTSQVTEGHAAGSWSPDGFPHGPAGGRLYVTALATCTLEVYYRYAPLYRRIKLD